MELVIEEDADGYPMPPSLAKPDMIDNGKGPENDMNHKGTVSDITYMPL